MSTPETDLEKVITNSNPLGKETVDEEATNVPSESSIKDKSKIVDWDGPDDKENPRNWSRGKKWAATGIVAAYTFVSPLASSMVAPGLPTIAADFHITSETVAAMTLSIFILAYAIGPLYFAPNSELYGRNINLQLANLFFLAFNIGCALSKNTTQLIVFRFFAGLGGSAPLSIGGGTINDLWAAEERGKAMAIYSLGPLVGPVVAPIAGGFMVETIGWRWIFWVITMVAGVVSVAGFILLRETYAPIILKRRAAARMKAGETDLKTIFEIREGTTPHSTLLWDALKRPIAMLVLDPICFVLSLYMAFIYGVLYLLFTTFPTLYAEVYHFNSGISGLMYLGPGIGFFASTLICAPLIDKVYRILKARNGDKGTPEMRVPMMLLGSTLVPIGLIWYGWTADKAVFWLLPAIGAGIFGCGMMVSFLCIQTYLVDAFEYAASAVSAATVFRSVCGFGFPLFGPAMYASLGNGWGNTLLALLSLAIGGPFPFFLYKYGAQLRARSRFGKTTKDD